MIWSSAEANEEQSLASRAEVLSNATWRLLQLRGYIDEQHQLTHWGKVLESALITAGSSKEFEEATLLAVELVRFKLLSPDTMFENYGGVPLNGTGQCDSEKPSSEQSLLTSLQLSTNAIAC